MCDQHSWINWLSKMTLEQILSTICGVKWDIKVSEHEEVVQCMVLSGISTMARSNFYLMESLLESSVPDDHFKHVECF